MCKLSCDDLCLILSEDEKSKFHLINVFSEHINEDRKKLIYIYSEENEHEISKVMKQGMDLY